MIRRQNIFFGIFRLVYRKEGFYSIIRPAVFFLFSPNIGRKTAGYINRDTGDISPFPKDTFPSRYHSDT